MEQASPRGGSATGCWRRPSCWRGHRRLPPDPGRELDLVVLPRGHHDLAGRHRLGARQRRRTGAVRGAHLLRRDYLCLPRRARSWRQSRAGSCPERSEGGRGRSKGCAITRSSAATAASDGGSRTSSAVPAPAASSSTMIPTRSRPRGKRAMLALEGDAHRGRGSRTAGLERAKALSRRSIRMRTTSISTLSARTPRPDLLIVARASDEDAERKLRQAGADRVVMPYSTAGRVMANLVLKPQVAVVPRRRHQPGRPGPPLRADRGSRRLPGDRTVDPRPAHPRAHRRLHRRRGQEGTAPTTRDPRRTRVFDAGDVLIGVGTTDDIRALEDLFAPAGASCLLLARSTGWPRRCRARGHRGRARAALRLRARRLRDQRRAPARAGRASARRASSREELADRRAGLPEVERAEVAGPGFVNLWLARRLVRRGARARSSSRRELRRRLAGAPRADPGRDGLGQPDRADHRRGRPQRRVRRLGRAAARARRARGRARVLLQRRRRADGALPCVGRGVRRGEEPPEDGYQGEYVARAGRSSTATRCRRCSSRSRRRSSASASTSTRGRCRASSSSGCRS